MLMKICSLAAAATMIAGCRSDRPTAPATNAARLTSAGPMNPALIAAGQTIFRFDTYGDQTFWTDTLRMHEVIRTSVSP